MKVTDLFKSNWKFWDELLKRGAVFSHIKDGPPRSLFQRLVAGGYPLIVFVLVTVCVVSMIAIPRKEWKWKTYLPALAMGSLLGWSWGIWMLKADPRFPAWLFAPWAIMHPEFVLSIEDWLFYPACTTLFYVFYRKVKMGNPAPASDLVHLLIISVYFVLTVFFLIFSATAGRSEAVMFALPGMLLYLYARERINVKKFLLFQIFVVGFETVWDLLAVSLLHYLPGLSWASQWIYLTFDAQGDYLHSSVFLDYGTHRWAWILMNPVEITPWFGIVGGLLNYAMFAGGDKLFYRGKP